jgi:hypothetical protein
MKPLETIFWLGTAGVLYMAANNIVKNVTKDVAKMHSKRLKSVATIAVACGGSSSSNQSTNLCSQNLHSLVEKPFYFLFNR